jgi:hypothetical protein
LNVYIQLQKELERDPNFVVPESSENREEGLFSLRNIVFAYLAYVVVTSVPKVVQRTVAEQMAAGTYEETHVPPIDSWIHSLMEQVPKP